MKRNKSLLVMCVILLILLAAYIPVRAADMKNIDAICDLVIMRAETMNDYYGGKMAYDQAMNTLREIESGPLLEDDLMNLKRWENTDIDSVDSTEITAVIVTEDRAKYLSANVTVRWHVSGLHGSDEFQADYSVKCEKYGKTLKLTQFF